MSDLTARQMQSRIRELEAEVKKLSLMIQKDSEMKYGLRWVDVPEAFERECENKIPILEEIKQNAISNDDGKPAHILIEGDNCHALKCLNYTHKGRVDIIYIDPPYNTGREFIYKDKRILEKYPGGQTIDQNHPLRHSTWLSFMSSRLELAKNLLAENGAIFISIDDNEQANLKLLCDRIFGEKNFVANFIWETKKEAKGIPPANMCVTNHEYITVYQKSDAYKFIGDKRNAEDGFSNPDNDIRGPWKRQYLQRFGQGFKERTITNPQNGMTFTFETPYTEEKMNKWIEDGVIIFPKDNSKYPARKEFFNEYENPFKPVTTNLGLYNTKVSSEKLKEIFDNEKVFDFSKPLDLIYDILKKSSKKSHIILDFFAGSGTTLHAVMKLNDSDGGSRQCILVQQEENGICRNVTYERNRRVMQGYKNSKGKNIAGLGNSLKYYKTAFVEKSDSANALYSDRIALAQKAGCLLSLAENTLEEIATTPCYQIFTDGSNRYTGVYFAGSPDGLCSFCRKLEELRDRSSLNRITAYFYCAGSAEESGRRFASADNIEIKPIPEQILKVYQTLQV